MKEPLTQRAGWLAAVIGEIVAVIGQFLLLPIAVGYFLVCFWVFDRLHVSNPDTQLALVLAPFVVGALGIGIYLSRKSWRGS